MVPVRAEHHQTICLSGLPLNPSSPAACVFTELMGFLAVSGCLDVRLSAGAARRRSGARTLPLPSLKHTCCVMNASSNSTKLRMLATTGKEACVLLGS
eukprot:COSAG02_NODE_624_length_19387_cov_90.736002_12_plen_98_part_00